MSLQIRYVHVNERVDATSVSLCEEIGSKLVERTVNRCENNHDFTADFRAQRNLQAEPPLLIQGRFQGRKSSSSLLTGNDSVIVVSLTIEPKVAVGCGTSVVEGIEAVPAPPTVGARNTRHDRSTTTERTPSTALDREGVVLDIQQGKRKVVPS